MNKVELRQLSLTYLSELCSNKERLRNLENDDNKNIINKEHLLNHLYKQTIYEKNGIVDFKISNIVGSLYKAKQTNKYILVYDTNISYSELNFINNKIEFEYIVINIDKTDLTAEYTITQIGKILELNKIPLKGIMVERYNEEIQTQNLYFKLCEYLLANKDKYNNVKMYSKSSWIKNIIMDSNYYKLTLDIFRNLNLYIEIDRPFSTLELLKFENYKVKANSIFIIDKTIANIDSLRAFLGIFINIDKLTVPSNYNYSKKNFKSIGEYTIITDEEDNVDDFIIIDSNKYTIKISNNIIELINKETGNRKNILKGNRFLNITILDNNEKDNKIYIREEDIVIFNKIKHMKNLFFL